MTSHPRKLAFLDGLRGLAALYVMIGHARWLLWEGYAAYKLHPDRYGPLAKLLVYSSAALRFGHEAVIFFFVLSGFVIHLRYARGIAEDSRAALDFGPYLYRRARRLYPPLILALLVTAGLDGLGRHLDLATTQGITLYPWINKNIGFDHHATTLVRNLAFIMDPVFGSDGPLWSLTYEWYFYILYPIAFLMTRRSWKVATLAIGGLSMVGFVPCWSRSTLWVQGVFQLMIVWWFGALLADRFTGRLKVRYTTLAWLSLALVVLVVPGRSPSVRDIIAGIGFTGLIACCLAHQEGGSGLSFLSGLQPLGEMSYTLYVVHFPVLVFISGCLMKASGGHLPEHFGWVASGIAGCLFVAWVLHLGVERPFVRGAFARRAIS